MESDAVTPPPLPSSALQFDTVEPQVAAADGAITAAGVVCANCQDAIAAEYYDVNGQPVCDGCRNSLAQLVEVPRDLGVLGRAAVFGIIAAILGAAVYYAVVAITDFEIGIVAIAIGYMVGWAVRRAAGGRGGRRFQVLAIVLTYWAVGLAYTPLVISAIRKAEQSETSQANAGASTPAAESDAPVNIPLLLGYMVGFSFALPVLVVAGSLPGSLISAAIIAFGMQQAWKMTGAPNLLISGPYRISPSATVG